MKSTTLIIIISICLWSCSSDNEPSIINQAPLNFTEVLTFEVDTLEIDMISSTRENSFFITYSSNNLNSENVLKYNTSTQTQTDLIHGDGGFTRQFEVRDDFIYSIGDSGAELKYDLNLNSVSFYLRSSPLGTKKHRIIKYNNEIIIIISGGLVFNSSINDYEMKISRIETTNENNYNEISTFPYGIRYQADGIVYDDKLFMFGGTDEVINYSEINIYDFIDDTWNQEALPYGIYESFISLYNDSVIVTGNKESDNSNAFIGLYSISTNTFSELTTSLI